MTVSNETLRELSDALDRFDAEKLAEALDRNTEASKALTESIDRLVRAFELLEQSQQAQSSKPES
jgi:cell division GTPase FtsZ